MGMFSKNIRQFGFRAKYKYININKYITFTGKANTRFTTGPFFGIHFLELTLPLKVLLQPLFFIIMVSSVVPYSGSFITPCL